MGPRVNLPDVTDHQLPPGFHLEVLAELAAPAEEVGGQQDGGGETGVLGHFVDLHQVGLGLLVRQEGNSQTGELKYNDQLGYRGWSQFSVKPCRLRSRMSLPCGGERCGWSSPSWAPGLAWDTPGRRPGQTGPQVAPTEGKTGASF